MRGRQKAEGRRQKAEGRRAKLARGDSEHAENHGNQANLFPGSYAPPAPPCLCVEVPFFCLLPPAFCLLTFYLHFPCWQALHCSHVFPHPWSPQPCRLTGSAALIYFGRMVDKIRLHLAGKLPEEYVPKPRRTASTSVACIFCKSPIATSWTTCTRAPRRHATKNSSNGRCNGRPPPGRRRDRDLERVSCASAAGRTRCQRHGSNKRKAARAGSRTVRISRRFFSSSTRTKGGSERCRPEVMGRGLEDGLRAKSGNRASRTLREAVCHR